MATGFGVDPTLDPANADIVLSGQSAEDTRRVWGSLYSDGILKGCEVTTSTTEMKYTIAPGAVVIPYSSGQNIPAPVYGGPLVVPAAPATGSRTDLIWARQNIPSVEGNSNVVVGYGTTLPARAVMLDKFTVNAGMKSTSQALRITDRRFAVPLSGGAGRLHQWTDTHVGVHDQRLLRQGQRSLTLATDRLIRMSVQSLLYADGAVGFDNSRYCEWFFLMTIDGTDMAKFTTPGLHQAWGTYNFEFYVL